MTFVSIHSRITAITEMTVCTISWTTTHIAIPHLSKIINVKGAWIMAEGVGFEPTDPVGSPVF